MPLVPSKVPLVPNIGFLPLSDAIGRSRAQEVAEFVDNWLISASVYNPSSINLNDFPDLKDIEVIKTFEATKVTDNLQDNYRFAEVHQCTLNALALNSVKKLGEKLDVSTEDAKKKIKCEQMRELIISYSQMQDVWEPSEDYEVYETGLKTKGSLVPPQGPGSDLRKGSFTAEIFIPQDTLGYNSEAFREEYFGVNNPHWHPFEDIEDLGFDVSDIKNYDRLIVFYKADATGQLAIVARCRISKEVHKIRNLIFSK